MLIFNLKRARLAAAFVAASSLLTSFAYELEPIEEYFEPKQDFSPSDYGKVAVVAWAPAEDSPLGVSKSEAEAFKQRQRETLAGYIRTAAEKGAKMVITPEFATVGYPDNPELPPEDDQFHTREELAPYVETIPGPTSNYFSALSKELHVYIHVGLAEVDPITGNYHNSVAVLGPEGNLIGSYRKMHLYSVEHDFLVPGTSPFYYESFFGKVGVTICSDVSSYEPIGSYREAAVQVNALSTSWAAWNSGMNAFRRAAVNGNSYVLAANQTYFPDSGVISPNGKNQSHIRQSSGIAYGYVPYAIYVRAPELLAHLQPEKLR